MAYFAQQVANGLHSAALYALLAYGYALVYGLTRRANFAHGALFAFAGQMLVLGAVFGYRELWLTLPAALAFGATSAFVFSGLAGHLLGRRVFAPLATASPNAFLVATLAAMIVLIELGRIAADTRDWWLPPLLPGQIAFFASDGFVVSLTRIQIAGIAGALMALAAAEIIVSRGRAGRIWRAACDDALAAALLGVDPRRVLMATVAAATALAAFGGVLATLHYGNMSFGAGLTYGLKVVFVAALGAGGRPLNAALGAAAVGLAEALWTAWLPLEWRDTVILGVLSLLLILKPGDRASGQW
ncbi:MAG: branched-chain amino acid ABC transporter permease [Phyllobacteriaceae bacterium]|nr:branched-chain amino acid ABC transporter permease [Phyllobacteriaceae bacterium]